MLLTDNQHHRVTAKAPPELNLLAASAALPSFEVQAHMQRGRRLRAEAMQRFGRRVGHGLRALASRPLAALRRWREVRETELALRSLSAQTLRDIGIDAYQIAAVARGMGSSRRDAAHVGAQVQQLRPHVTPRDDRRLDEAA